MDETTVLFRPIGQKELELIRDSEFTKFPPRLPEQPIFYPVLSEEMPRKSRESGMPNAVRKGWAT